MEIASILGGYGQRLEKLSPKGASDITSANFKKNIGVAASTDVSVQGASTAGEAIFSKESLPWLSDQEINFFNSRANVTTQYSKNGKSMERMNVQSSLNIHI
ncbi:hypothetical protein [uncultured Desulfovibrio sp.]|uniref:hypothetical protein n=1 Tax=uncultured Desulfovibrio sp. TaxID=167968 RepID=UPI002607D2FC|nr:hypothetical protein [uncultured Desulfovibrio sp.]